MSSNSEPDQFLRGRQMVVCGLFLVVVVANLAIGFVINRERQARSDEFSQLQAKAQASVDESQTALAETVQLLKDCAEVEAKIAKLKAEAGVPGRPQSTSGK
jgi:hypothetical protein